MPFPFQDHVGNILGTDTANNLYSSSNVAANADGSMIERQEAIKDQITAIATGVKTTTIADATTIPNNTQAAAGLLATASGGAVMIEEIVVQRAADNLVGPTNYEFTSDNAAGATGAAGPVIVMLLAKFNAATTSVATIDGATKQVPFVLESGKKLYIHGDDAATSAGGSTDFYIKYKPVVEGASLV